MEDALTVARMDAGDAAEKIHNLEMKLNALEKDKIDEEGVFNAKLEEYISKMSSQQKHAEDALVQLKTKNESLSKRLRKTAWISEIFIICLLEKVTKSALFEGTYDMKSSEVPLNSFSLFFIDIYWFCQYIFVKPIWSSKEAEVKSLEEDKDKFRKELEEEIEYLLNEKNQMQSRHMVSSFIVRVSHVVSDWPNGRPRDRS